MTVKVKPLEFKNEGEKYEVAETPFGTYVCKHDVNSDTFYWWLEQGNSLLAEQFDLEPSYTMQECKEAVQAHWESLIHSCITIEG